MIDPTNKEWRYIITPDGRAEVDFFTEDGHVWVWLGEFDKRNRREHRCYDCKDCEEE